MAILANTQFARLHVLHFTYFTAVLYQSFHTDYLMATPANTQFARLFISLSTWLLCSSMYLLYCCILLLSPYWLPDGNTSQHAIRATLQISLYCTLCSSRYLRYYYTWPNSLLYCTYFTLHTLLLYCTTPSIPPTWWQHRPPRNPHVLSYLSRLDFHALHFTDFTPLLLHYFTTHLLSQPL